MNAHVGRRIVALCALAGTLMLAGVAAASDALQQRASFRSEAPAIVEAGPTMEGGRDSWVVRSRKVRIDTDVLRAAAHQAATGQSRIQLPLFDDTVITVEVRDAAVRGAERFTLQGVVSRMPASHVTFSVWDTAFSGFIMIPQLGQFKIVADEPGWYRVEHIDPNLMPLCPVSERHVVRGKAGAGLDEPMVQAGDDPIRLTLLGFFTQEAASQAGSGAELFALLNADVATMNAILANSGVNLEVHLITAAMVPYLECNDEEQPPYPDCMGMFDLSMLAAGAGDLAPVHDWRSTLCADLVTLLVHYSEDTGEPCGIAYLLGEPTIQAFDQAPFSVINVRCMPGTTLAHEIGHNLGANHDHAQGGTGTYPYSFGHRFPVPGGDPVFPWITVMSYPPGMGVPYFSNPTINLFGYPIGIPAGLPLQADNALTFTNNAPYVASFSYQVCLGAEERLVPSGPYPTIQSAIDASNNGDRIVVSAGTYNEAIDFKGKAVYLRSSSGPGSTILDGAGLGRSVITCNSGEELGSVIHGFTITNGNAISGGAMYIRDSSLAVVDCVFDGNSALLSGGAVYLENSHSRFLLCEFADNISQVDGGAMYIVGGSPHITGSAFQSNSAGLGTGGKGGAIFIKESDVTIWDTRIGYAPSSPNPAHGNVAGHDGGGVWVEPDDHGQFSTLPRFGSTSVCGNVPSNLIDPWTDLGNATVCALDFDLRVPQDFPTIQEAIDEARDGDTIVVDVGEYNERIDLKGKAIDLRSMDPTDPAVVAGTIINGDGGGTVIKCVSGETSQTRIRGFTITGGNAAFPANYHGGGIRIVNSSPHIEHCVLLENHAHSAGGGMHVVGGAPTILNCEFIANTTGTGEIPGSGSGGGLNIDNSPLAVIQSLKFVENFSKSVGGAVATNLSNLLLTDLVFENNVAQKWGGAIFNNGKPTVIDSEFRGNTAGEGGGAIYTADQQQTAIANSFFCQSTPDHLDGPWLDIGGNMFFDVCPPLNNFPENAIPINSPAASIAGSFLGATSDGTSSCDPHGVDVFFSYTILGGPMTLHLDTCGSEEDVNLAVFDSAGNELACNTACEGSQCGAPNACISFASLPDDTYLIRVSRSASAAADTTEAFQLNFKRFHPTFGDVNLDGVVDISDMMAVLGAWGVCESTACTADLNGDGVVDISDMMEVLANWG